MNFWFEQILPYLVLVIFHLNSNQVDHQAITPSGDQPSDPPKALYCPPGALFGPVHFTKYPPNPSYAEYNLETILIADPLARTRETEYIGREGKWYKRPPRLFKDKYNYLPAYFIPMTPPLTPQPNHPMETPTAAKATSTQLFGVLYITLIGMVNTMMPNSGPWSLLGQSVSYIIKLTPILWWALPSGLAIFQPKPTNASTYAWLPDTYLQNKDNYIVFKYFPPCNSAKTAQLQQEIQGCFFQFSQALIKHLKSKKLFNKYLNNGKGKCHFALTQFAALTVVQPEHSGIVFEALLEDAYIKKHSIIFKGYLDYFERQ
ncbi:hypothetical protein DSO57_1013665 [Entomophthora muscae]|uniref:Uncharacterized protein n=1 Tax=Entomophthora muscae TaxID=34485 RepID=A0ACC2U3E9_9FUNG|nr:hypothetical protein DSO57_1013665 [Entomophthora muscae]